MILPPHPTLFKQTAITPSLPPFYLLPSTFHPIPLTKNRETMLDSGIKFPEKHAHLSDHKGRVSDSSNSYGGMMNYGVLATKKAENYGNCRSWNTIGVFGAETKVVDDGVCSPPLWKSSPSRSPQGRGNHYRSLSPSSRAQAIARGQKELMEMVSTMPEGCYELSLKDLVEKPMVEVKQEESFGKERSVNNEEEMHRREKEKKKIDRKVKMNASGNIDNGGLLLKMVFPISWGSRTKKKKNNSAMNNSLKDGRVSPKPLLLADGSAKGVDKEWWKKKLSEDGDSESGGLSSNSGSSKSSGSGRSSSRSSGRNSTRHGSGGCWPFILTKKGKRAE